MEITVPQQQFTVTDATYDQNWRYDYPPEHTH